MGSVGPHDPHYCFGPLEESNRGTHQGFPLSPFGNLEPLGPALNLRVGCGSLSTVTISCSDCECAWPIYVLMTGQLPACLVPPFLQPSSFPSPLRISMVYPRELPKKKSSKEESKSSEELPDKKCPVSRQKQQLLVDCLTSIIRYPLLHAPSFSTSHLSSYASPSFRRPDTSPPGGGEGSFARSLGWETLGSDQVY